MQTGDETSMSIYRSIDLSIQVQTGEVKIHWYRYREVLQSDTSSLSVLTVSFGSPDRERLDRWEVKVV